MAMVSKVTGSVGDSESELAAKLYLFSTARQSVFGLLSVKLYLEKFGSVVLVSSRKIK